MPTVLECLPALKRLANAMEIPHQLWTTSPNVFLPREDEIVIPSSMGPGTRQSDLPTSPPPLAFWRLKKLDPSANAMDYWVKADNAWDVDGILSDVDLCHEDFLLQGPVDANTWLNQKIAKDGITALDSKTDQYCQSLTLALQLFMQETADNAEIALSGLLAKTAIVDKDAVRMHEDQADAHARIHAVLAEHQRVDSSTPDNPTNALRQIHEALAKIELIRRALKRRK